MEKTLPARANSNSASGARRKFTPYEDALLAHLVTYSHLPVWDEIASHMPGRNARQCRERWKHYVSVGCQSRPWTQAEDALLLERESRLGPRWTAIARYFYNRSDIQVKCRWIQLTGDRKVLTDPPAPEIVETKQYDLIFDEDRLVKQSDLDVNLQSDATFSDLSGFHDWI
jgi:hypothetical protein